MPVVVALLAALGAAYFWYHRARNAAQMTQELAGVASEVMNAARRFGFRRQANQHPVEGVTEPPLAIAAIGVAYLELSGLPTAEERSALIRAVQSHVGLDLKGAEEALILGRWLVGECQGPGPAVARISRRLAKLDRKGSFEPLMAVLKDVAAADGGQVSTRQKEALEDIAHAFGLA